MQRFAIDCETLHFGHADGEGFEPLQDSSGNSQVSEGGGAKSSAVGAPNRHPDPLVDPELKQLVEAWGTLTQTTREAILALVNERANV